MLFFDSNIEKIVLSFLLQDTKHVDEFLQEKGSSSCFYIKEGIDLCKLILQQFSSFHTTLSRASLELLLSSSTFKDDAQIGILLFFDEVSIFVQTQAVRSDEFRFYFSQFKDLKLKRDLIGVLNSVTDQLQIVNKSGEEILNSLTVDVLNTQPLGKEKVIDRRFVYESVPFRKQLYLDKRREPEKFKGIPFGMKVLDEKTNGIQKTFLTTIIGFTGKGKSRFLLNIGYNASFLGYVVMYITIEISAEYLEYLWDSRDSVTTQLWLDFHKIAYGQLDAQGEQSYLLNLDRVQQQKFPFYIIDMPEGCTPANIKNEVFTFRKKYGHSPDLIIIDYGNLMTPNQRGYSEPQDQGNIFKELKQLARKEKIAVLTAGQQNKKGEEAKIPDNLYVALSNKITENSDAVFFLKRDVIDDINHQMHVHCTKQRYGPTFHTTLYTDFGYNYIGDNEIPWSNQELTVIFPQLQPPTLEVTPQPFFEGRDF